MYYMHNGTLEAEQDLEPIELKYSAFSIDVNADGNYVEKSIKIDKTRIKDYKSLVAKMIRNNGDGLPVSLTDDIQQDVDSFIGLCLSKESSLEDRKNSFEELMRNPEYRLRQVLFQGTEVNGKVTAGLSKHVKANEVQGILLKDKVKTLNGGVEVKNNFNRVNTVIKPLHKQVKDVLDKLDS